MPGFCPGTVAGARALSTLLDLSLRLVSTIFRKDEAFKEAPPTKKPSISVWPFNSFAFSGLTEPPYTILMLSAISWPTAFETHLRMYEWTSCAWSGVAVLPVPIAQTGSYAITMFSKLFEGTRVATERSWRVMTDKVLPLSRSSSVSPTHKTTFSPAFKACTVFIAMVSSDSLSSGRCLRSECPRITQFTPTSLSISAVYSPV
mmetsp:Transcript_30792/g.43111  ORF Transcript_30792/g.43111 Transcript_30792/m.43111 type:complete len:203 (-) Transcript_30792:560-1168(-)